MIKHLFFTVLCTVSFAAMASVDVQTSGNQRTTILTLDGLSFSTQQTERGLFAKATLQGVDGYQGVDYEIGKPLVPVIRLYVQGDVSVDYAKSELLTMRQQPRLMPAQPPLVKLPNAKVPFAFNEQAYQATSLRKGAAYELSDPVSIRGVKQRLLTLYPVAYNPVNNEYQFIQQFTVVENGVESQEIIPMARGDLMALVVGTELSESPALDRYMAHKITQGFEVEKIIIANATPDKIRTALKSLYHASGGQLAAAILIGDSDTLPGYNGDYVNAQTDHYYRAIDTDSYKTDINGPDIGLGRIAVRTEAQLADVVDKYIRYDILDAPNWLDAVSFIATDDLWEVAEGTHNYAILNYTTPLEFVGEFPEPVQMGGDQLYAVTHKVSDERVLSAINAGRSIVNYSGHGTSTSWAGPRVTQRGVYSLDHPTATPFVVSNACLTGRYETSESFAETWQRHPQGAVMFWGGVSFTYWDEDDILERRMYDLIFKNGYRQFSDIMQGSLLKLWAHYGDKHMTRYYWEVYTPFGDPTMHLKTRSGVINP